MNERTYGVTIQNCLNKERPDPILPTCAIAANGVHFRKDFQGVIPNIIEGLYSERKGIKKEMLDNQQELEHIERELKKRGLEI
jgi:DNA polymerase elongation subunit (family B)